MLPLKNLIAHTSNLVRVKLTACVQKKFSFLLVDPIKITRHERKIVGADWFCKPDGIFRTFLVGLEQNLYISVNDMVEGLLRWDLDGE